MNRSACFAFLLAATLSLGCGDSDHKPPAEPASPAEPALAGESEPERLLPEHPHNFRIELSSGPCLGDCPTYSMSLDQDGYVSFSGARCLTRPGVWERRVSPEAARSVYDALLATPFDSLGDRYVSEEDGCMLATDAPISIWKVVADGKKKSLKHDHGCEGVAGLSEVDAVRPLLQQEAGVLDLLETNVGCDHEFNRIPATMLRISREGAALGVLQIDTMYEAPRYFELRDCAGKVLAKGDAHTERGRVVLLDEDLMTVALPADLGDAASLVLEFGETTADAWRHPVLPTEGRALREDGDIGFQLSVASSCE